VYPSAQLPVEASEAAADQDTFWPMHDVLLAHEDALTTKDLMRYAGEADLHTARFRAFLSDGAGAARVAEDVDPPDLSDVGTPTFFTNGLGHYGLRPRGADRRHHGGHGRIAQHSWDLGVALHHRIRRAVWVHHLPATWRSAYVVMGTLRSPT
jgi:hypothetical protein